MNKQHPPVDRSTRTKRHSGIELVEASTYRVVAQEKFWVSARSFIYYAPWHLLFDGGAGPQGLELCQAFWESSVRTATSARNTRAGRRFRFAIEKELPAIVHEVSAFRYADALPNLAQRCHE